MRLISVKNTLLVKYNSVDPQVLLKDKRPAVLVVKLLYRGKNYDFAIPLRSNIPPAVPKNEYFALPNRHTTRPKHRHGLHYTKMFPISKQFYERYRTEESTSSQLYIAIVSKNEKRIVEECQAYLKRYESGDRPVFATNIDLLINELDKLSAK